MRVRTRRLAYVAEDYDQELGEADTSSDSEKNYELLYSQVITASAERFRCPRCCFSRTSSANGARDNDAMSTSAAICARTLCTYVVCSENIPGTDSILKLIYFSVPDC